MFGFSLVDLEGINILELVMEEYRFGVLAVLVRLQHGFERARFEACVVRKDGRVVKVRGRRDRR